MNEESADRTEKITDLVLKQLKKSRRTEIVSVKDLDKEELDRYLAIGKYNKSLAAALKDSRRQVLIFRSKI